MAFIPVPLTAEVNIRQTLYGEEMINTLYFTLALGWDEGSLTDLATRLDGVLVDQYPDMHNVGSIYLGLRLRNLDHDGGEVLIVPASASTVGTVGGGSEQNNVAWCVKFTTGLAGRSYRGRVYHGGIAGSMLVSINHMDTGFASDIIDHYVSLVTAAGEAGGVHVVVSRRHNKVALTEGVTTPVTAITYTDLVLDSMRNRLPGRGA